MKNPKLRKWLPIALCCLPGVAVAAIVVIGMAFGGAVLSTTLSGPLGVGLLVLAVAACPMSMGLMMWRQRRSSQGTEMGHSSMGMECCAPGKGASPDRLAALRAQREALERELAELQAK